MGHYISGIVGPNALLREFALERGLHRPAVLSADLQFLPLSDNHLDVLFSGQGGSDTVMTYLSPSLRHTLASLSMKGTVAYIETEYHGGMGSQGATVYAEGQCLMVPEVNEGGPISKALRILGVVRGADDYDEFDTVGLGRHRDNDGWIEAANHES